MKIRYYTDRVDIFPATRPWAQRIRAACLALALVGAGLAAGPSWAAGIVNEDSRPHSIVVTEGHFRNELKLEPGEAATDVCAQCRFSVKDVGEIDARDNDLVVITGESKLEKRS